MGADIVALDLATYGNKISARSGAYLTSIDGAKPGCEPELNPLLCCCAGFGCIRQVIEGTGTAFVEASGTVERKALKAGEKLGAGGHDVHVRRRQGRGGLFVLGGLR